MHYRIVFAVFAALCLSLMLGLSQSEVTAQDLTYPIVDTGQTAFYDAQSSISSPVEGAAFYGQDAQYQGSQPTYVNNGDGTVTDRVTGLMWTQTSDLNGDGIINISDKLTYDQAIAAAGSFSLAGYDDWRLPTIKELYSLIVFTGVDVSGYTGTDTASLTPFIDPVFAFGYGDTSANERIIDAQFATSTRYVSTTMGGNQTMFGVNFADGRIKGYPIVGQQPGQSDEKLFYVLYVRGNASYGINAFVDNGNGTISDNATGLMWMQNDSGSTMLWQDALSYCESLDTAGFSDWRLPDAKELQSLVDYTRAPDTANSAAIDPLFNTTSITNEAGQTDYPMFWSGTTHNNMQSADHAAYVAFGRAMGYMNTQWMDVHGAGAQRSDPKTGNPGDYPTGHGPQGDAIRIYNAARCVRGGVANIVTSGENTNTAPSSTGNGQNGQGGQGQGQGTPPQEAITACASLTEGSTCSFNTPNGTVSGTCMTIQSQLSCVPEGGPGGQSSPPGGG